MILRENFVRHQLKDMVANNIIVDAFTPKAGTEEEVIVVTFNVHDEAAGKDLARFIELGPEKIIDVDFSEFSNNVGTWQVHMEVERNVEFWDVIDAVLADIENLVHEIRWQFTMYLTDTTYDYAVDTDACQAAIILDKEKYISRKEYRRRLGVQAIKKFLLKANYTAEIDDESFAMEGRQFSVASQGRWEQYSEQIEPLKTSSDTRVLEGTLGAEYQVYMLENANILLINNDNDMCMEVIRN